MILGDFDAMLYVTDVRRSVEFYRDVLGFSFDGWWSEEAADYVESFEDAGSPGYAQLSAGEQRIALHAAKGDAVLGGGAVYHLKVEDVDAFRESARAAGGEPSEPRDMPWGWRMTFLSDPDGHAWGFFSLLDEDVHG